MHPKSITLSAVERREYVRERYRLDGIDAVAKALGMRPMSVKDIAWKLGILTPPNRWSAADIADLRRLYEKHRGGRIPLMQWAKAHGRIAPNVSRKAREMGLTEADRPKQPPRKPVVNKWPTIEESRAAIGRQTRERMQRDGHPRGALGMTHTAAAKAKMSAAAKRMWADPSCRLNSEEHRQSLSDRAIQRVKEGVFFIGEQMYSRAAHGRRADLGNQYFRSAWEANYCRYLNFLAAQGHIVSWEYEKHTFWFEAIRRGVRSYLPDFRVVFPDGHHEWHEVKGWMDPKSKTKLKRMAKYYPSEIVRVIDAAWFRNIERSGVTGAIPHWERKGSRRAEPAA